MNEQSVSQNNMVILCSRKWQTTLEVDDDDEEVLDVVEPTGSAPPQSEVINIETNKETTETSHLTTSEQEERQTFVITGKYTWITWL